MYGFCECYTYYYYYLIIIISSNIILECFDYVDCDGMPLISPAPMVSKKFTFERLGLTVSLEKCLSKQEAIALLIIAINIVVITII